MGTALAIAIVGFFLIGANSRAQILAALGNALGTAGQALDNAAAAEGDGEEIPYGGAADQIPNSNGFNTDPNSGLQVNYLGTGAVASSWPHLSPPSGAAQNTLVDGPPKLLPPGSSSGGSSGNTHLNAHYVRASGDQR